MLTPMPSFYTQVKLYCMQFIYGILCDALIFFRAILPHILDVTDKQILFNLILSVNVNYLETRISFSFEFYCKPHL